MNLNKQQKRDDNYKNFVEKVQTNRFIKKYFKKTPQEIYIILNHKSKIDENDDDDKTDLDL